MVDQRFHGMISSFLQCLCHMPPIREYFLLDPAGMISRSSIISGSSSSLSLALSKVVKDVWSNAVVADGDENFLNYNQASCQVYCNRFMKKLAKTFDMSMLNLESLFETSLKALDEELNSWSSLCIERGEDEKTSEKVSCSHSDSPVARWFDGVITQREECCFSQCSWGSTLCQSFKCLNVELPYSNLESCSVEISLSRVDGSLKTICLSVPPNATAWIVKQEIQRTTGISPTCCFLAQVNHGRIGKFFANRDLVHVRATMGLLIGYEVVEDRDQNALNQGFPIPVTLLLCSGDCHSPHFFGIPQVILLTSHSITYDELLEHVRSRVELISKCQGADDFTLCCMKGGRLISLKQPGKGEDDPLIPLCASFQLCVLFKEEFSFKSPEIQNQIMNNLRDQHLFSKTSKPGAKLVACLEAEFARRDLVTDRTCQLCSSNHLRISKSIAKPPRVLAIRINRNSRSQGVSRKIEIPVDCEMHMDLKDFLESNCLPVNQPGVGYDLFACIIHYGDAEDGFYGSLVRTNDDHHVHKWYNLGGSNGSVEKVEKDFVLSVAKYASMLFYVRSDVPFW
eukprot:TRINITY_DN8913_c0_g1_i1.p1 TRINITY_DN8913_c0_g1~~TRINITY_DN8913_c0_g1_i1.p1  ORF type:complete len:568 (+),score=133.27 TRINITY_DN8913_c0_g1_i1:260-1963(+)